MERVTIRSILPQDREGIQRIIARVGVFNPEELKIAMELVDEALTHADRDEYHILCAVNNRKVVMGYVCFGPVPMTDRCFDLYWIAVDAEYERQGLGGRLLEEVEAFARKRHARRIYVETSSSAPYRSARSFYVRKGYGLECVLDDFYRQGDHKMIFMKKL